MSFLSYANKFMEDVFEPDDEDESYSENEQDSIEGRMDARDNQQYYEEEEEEEEGEEAEGGGGFNFGSLTARLKPFVKTVFEDVDSFEEELKRRKSSRSMDDTEEQEQEEEQQDNLQERIEDKGRETFRHQERQDQEDFEKRRAPFKSWKERKQALLQSSEEKANDPEKPITEQQTSIHQEQPVQVVEQQQPVQVEEDEGEGLELDEDENEEESWWIEKHAFRPVAANEDDQGEFPQPKSEETLSTHRESDKLTHPDSDKLIHPQSDTWTHPQSDMWTHSHVDKREEEIRKLQEIHDNRVASIEQEHAASLKTLEMALQDTKRQLVDKQRESEQEKQSFQRQLANVQQELENLRQELETEQQQRFQTERDLNKARENEAKGFEVEVKRAPNQQARQLDELENVTRDGIQGEVQLLGMELLRLASEDDIQDSALMSALASTGEKLLSAAGEGRTTSHIVKLQEELATANEARKEMEMQLESAHLELMANKEQIAALEAEVERERGQWSTQVQGLRTALEKERAEDTTTASSSELEIERLENEKHALEVQLSKLKQGHTALMEEREKVALEKSDLEKRYASLSSAFDNLQISANTTFKSEQDLAKKCTELSEALEALEEELAEAKRIASKAEGDKHLMKQQVENLQEDLKKRTQAHQKGVSTLSGQLNEIERLRSIVADSDRREQVLRKEIEELSAAHQIVHRLKDDLQATRSELHVAETDVKRLSSERESLNLALGELTREKDRQASNYERKLKQVESLLADAQSQLSSTQESFEAWKSSHLKSESSLREQLQSAQQRCTDLETSVKQLEESSVKKRGSLRRNRSIASSPDAPVERSLSARSLASLESAGTDAQSHVSSPTQPSELQVETETIAKDTGVATTEQDDGELDDILDREMLKNLVVRYFENKQFGTFQAQKEILTLLATMLEMNDEEKAIIGLLQAHPALSERLAKRKGSEGKAVGLFDRLLFGAEKKVHEEKKAVDWDALEEAVKSKPFSDLFEDILNQSI